MKRTLVQYRVKLVSVLLLKPDGVMEGGNEIGARLAFETTAALRRRPDYLLGRIISGTGALVRRILDGAKITHQQKGKKMSKSEKKEADNVERAKKFYAR